MDLYDRAAEGMTKVEATISSLPVISEYRSKEMRRDADKRLREQIARYLENSRRKLTGLQRDMVSAGNLRDLPSMERAVGRLQLLIDRIRTASYGYAPFWDIDEVREPQLDQLLNFDQQLATHVTTIESEVDVLAEAVNAADAFRDELDALMDTLAQTHQLFDQRAQMISYLGGDSDAPTPDAEPTA
ncbi:MAG: hypothetical protein J5I90_11195 [Caldilineales bacterium]|nr:hypothetical protein [Caldilineales bacterium]